MTGNGFTICVLRRVCIKNISYASSTSSSLFIPYAKLIKNSKICWRWCGNFREIRYKNCVENFCSLCSKLYWLSSEKFQWSKTQNQLLNIHHDSIKSRQLKTSCSSCVNRLNGELPKCSYNYTKNFHFPTNKNNSNDNWNKKVNWPIRSNVQTSKDQFWNA